MSRVLVLANTDITESISSLAIRAWELAHVLARDHDVTLGTLNREPVASTIVNVCCYEDGSLPRLLEEHDVVVACGYPLRRHPIIRRRARHLVVDLYDPYLVSNLHQYQHLDMKEQVRIHEYSVDAVLEHLEAGDFFICASERQRDYWMGALTLANRLNPPNHKMDPALRTLLDVVGFGLPQEVPTSTGGAIKGAVPGINKDDVVVLWGGGIWAWLDPLTAVRAMARISTKLPKVKLYFMGMRQSNTPEFWMTMGERARRLAKELEVVGRTVFFRDQWVPYRDRVNFLCDADIAITLDREHFETRLAYRTRVLDYLWAALPIVSTTGDVLCESVVNGGAGISVDEGDVEAVSVALATLAENTALRTTMSRRARTLSESHTWTRVAVPLLSYCADPWRAADKDGLAMTRPKMGRRRLLLRHLLQVTRSRGRREASRFARLWVSGLHELALPNTSKHAK